MSATTEDRNTVQWGTGEMRIGEWPVYTLIVIPGGTLVARDTSGYAKLASDAASRTFAGVSESQADNSAGASGAINVRVHRRGVFKFASATTFTAADIGKQVYVSDNQTVALTGTSHSLKCGRLVAIDDDGDVWIEIDLDVDSNTPTS
ncbi:MAG: hypothetical protein PHI18_00190 [bacterium]|nr:hypothetical protein [bacterium]